jgi:hypothetical protein
MVVGPRIVVTLIHGTFARGAAWTKSERSPLREAIVKRLGERAHFVAWEWSGKNSFNARLVAGTELDRYFRNSRERDPGARHYVVAHSHGGTVVAYALRGNPDLAKALDGVVFLSTPFVQARYRPDGMILQRLFYAGLFALGGTVAGWFQDAALRSIGVTLQETVYVALLCSGIAACVSLHRSRSRTQVARSVVELLEKVNLFDISPQRAVLLRATGDEASALLATSHFVTWLLKSVLVPISKLSLAALDLATRASAGLGRLFKPALATISAFALLVVLSGFQLESLPASLGAGGVVLVTVAIGVVAYVAGIFFFPAIAIASIVVAALLSVLSLIVTPFVVSFGASFMTCLTKWMHIDFSPEPAPTGAWAVYYYEQLGQNLSNPAVSRYSGGLQHSASYADPRACEYIATWIAQGLEQTHSC